MSLLTEKKLKIDFRKRRGKSRGRKVDPQALQEVQDLLGDSPRSRDLLIEALHLIHDRYHYISAKHLVALAQEYKLAPTEVFEVATFYHHFDVIRENETPPPSLTVRVCDSMSCRMAGAENLIEELDQKFDESVRVQRVPCIGRCQHAPVAVVGQNPVDLANPAKVKQKAELNDTIPSLPNYVDYNAYRNAGGYQVYQSCVWGEKKLKKSSKF